MFRVVPGFLEGVPGCSGFFTLFQVFRGVPGCSGVPCSGVPVFRCSGVTVFRCSGVPGITTCRKFGRFEESTKLFSEGFWMK